MKSIGYPANVKPVPFGVGRRTAQSYIQDALKQEASTQICYCGKIALYRKGMDGFCEKHKAGALR